MDIKIICNGKEYKLGDKTNLGEIKYIKINKDEAVFNNGRKWVYFKDLK